jgi:hypothetical protein
VFRYLRNLELLLRLRIQPLPVTGLDAVAVLVEQGERLEAPVPLCLVLGWRRTTAIETAVRVQDVVVPVRRPVKSNSDVPAL